MIGVFLNGYQGDPESFGFLSEMGGPARPGVFVCGRTGAPNGRPRDTFAPAVVVLAAVYRSSPTSDVHCGRPGAARQAQAALAAHGSSPTFGSTIAFPRNQPRPGLPVEALAEDDQSLQVQLGFPHWQPGAWVQAGSPHLQSVDLQQLASGSLVLLMK